MESRERLTNWAGNLQYSSDKIYFPRSVEEVQELVRSCERLRALGSRHSFNKIADNTENLVCVQELNKIISLNKEANNVTVEAGIKYGDLCVYLDENGYALHNLASLPHISVGGSCATATHGSGVRHGNLATAVSAIEFVDGTGEIVTLTREKNSDELNGAVVGLGALGIVTKITLDLVPKFNMHQVVYRNLPMKALEKNFNEIVSSGYSVSLFTNWSNQNINEVWIKDVSSDTDSKDFAPEFHGAKLATEKIHPVEVQSAEPCTDQLGIPGPWYERMPHFKMGFKPSTGHELQTEYFVPREYAFEAIMAIEKFNEKITPHLLITEIRTIKSDNLWMSPNYKLDSIGIHFTWKPEWESVQKVLVLIEEALAPFNFRPHWAKMFLMEPSTLQSKYERISDFKKLVEKYDPKSKFRNDFIDKYLYGK